MARYVTGSIAVAILALSTAPSVKTQTHENHDAAVQPDRVLIGPEYIPRRLDLPTKLIVPAGKTEELPPESTYDYIEVAGTLRVSRTHDTALQFTHLINLPGGTIDVGTQADPIPCDRRVEFIIRDVPLDTDKDPFQWGNGFVNFGRDSRVGCRKTSFVEATGALAAGATEITLATAPVYWQPGDELLIPDSAAP